MKFIKSSNQNELWIININHIKAFGKSKQYFDIEGKKYFDAIYFALFDTEDSSLYWKYDSEAERDADFERISKLLGVG